MTTNSKPISNILLSSKIETKQTKAQKNGTISNMRMGYIFRLKVADIILEIAKNDPRMKTKRIVKYVNKELNSRKKDGEKEYNVGMRTITRAIKENIDKFPKSFIKKRRMDLDTKITPILHHVVHEKTCIDKIFENKKIIHNHDDDDSNDYYYDQIKQDDNLDKYFH